MRKHAFAQSANIGAPHKCGEIPAFAGMEYSGTFASQFIKTQIKITIYAKMIYNAIMPVAKSSLHNSRNSLAREKTGALWAALQKHCAANSKLSPMQLCNEDPRRFSRFSLCFDDLLLDFSKTTLTEKSLSLLLQLAKESGVFAKRDAMFAGEAINKTENRAALHIALRADAKTKIVLQNGENIMPAVAEARAEMLDFADACRKGRIAAANGARFSDVVNIGIGGSHLGPETAAIALQAHQDGLRAHFVSSMDEAQIADALSGLAAEKTLIVASSKSFSTAETAANADYARRWLISALGARAAKQHIVAATSAPQKAREFGAGKVFAYPEWIGGRYSVWGAAGLPLALAIGKKRFLDFLSGAREMDDHFASASPKKNLPLMLALAGVWHRNFCNFPTRASLPYDWRLRLLPAYLQQLDMESNGKSGMSGAKTKTAPIVWGSSGPDGQHAYFQFLHQGTDVAPCEFIVAAQDENRGRQSRRRMLIANCLAQSAALMRGDNARDLPPHRRFAGGRPSLTIMHRKLTPYSLGRLLALFEHRTFAESVLWGTNPFDQWGVELGKTLAKQLHRAVSSDSSAAREDSSTRGLLRHYRRLTGD